MKEEPLLLLSDLQKLINQVVLIDYTIIILGVDEMHLDQSALGILRKAEDKNGRKYMDWRIPYMDQPGLIMVYKSDSRYEKYQVYFFTSPASKCPGKYLHTTYGSIQVEDGSLTIRTKNSVYEFELDASCVSEVDMILLLHTVNEYFRDDGM